MQFLSFQVMIGFVLCVIGILGCFVAVDNKKTGHQVFFCIGTCLFLFLFGLGSFGRGRLAERTLDLSHNYIVKAKKGGNSMPLLVYDMVDKKDSVIDLESYPPSEFREVIMADGKIMLIPK